MALAAEVDVRDLGLLLKDGAHDLREVRIDVDDLLELVEDERDPPIPLTAEPAGQLKEMFEGRIDVVPTPPGCEREAE